MARSRTVENSRELIRSEVSRVRIEVRSVRGSKQQFSVGNLLP